MKFGKNSIFIFLGIVLIIFLTTKSAKLNNSILDNLNRLAIIKVGLDLDFTNITNNDELQDGIPDKWSVEAWGGSKEIYHISPEAYHGKSSASIEHTNLEGGATLTQNFSVEPDSILTVGVQNQGDPGAVRIQFWDHDSNAWTSGIRRNIDSSFAWQETTFDVDVPRGVKTARILLYAVTGVTLFDDVYVGIDNEEKSKNNLLSNPSFEEDGSSEDPYEWWTSLVRKRIAVTRINNSNIDLSYLNILDMINSRFDSIHHRALQHSDDCAFTPQMTSYLLSQSDRIKDSGGLAAQERLYQLAISLAPNCPRPYAALANLYSTSKSFWKAANLYSLAAELSSGSILEGRYAFEAGLLHWTYTGDMEQAIELFQIAESIGGWEPSIWYAGAASYYLGRSLEYSGRYSEAIEAYQRVLECPDCFTHHSGAKSHLEALTNE